MEKKVPLSKVYSDMTLIELKNTIECLEYAQKTLISSYDFKHKMNILIAFARDAFNKKICNLIAQTDFEGLVKE